MLELGGLTDAEVARVQAMIADLDGLEPEAPCDVEPAPATAPDEPEPALDRAALWERLALLNTVLEGLTGEELRKVSYQRDRVWRELERDA